MTKKELAEKIYDLIKDEVLVYPEEIGVAYDPYTMNPIISIMESKEDQRKRFHIEIFDMLEV